MGVLTQEERRQLRTLSLYEDLVLKSLSLFLSEQLACKGFAIEEDLLLDLLTRFVPALNDAVTDDWLDDQFPGRVKRRAD
jgi:hypothetical protein